MAEFFTEHLRAVQDFQLRSDEIVLDLVKANEKFVLDLNRQEQLFKGVDADGKKITPGYRPLTIRIKRAKGQPIDRVTWKDKGNLYRSFFIRRGNKVFSIEATDKKLRKLQQQYKTEGLGLNDASLQALGEFMEPKIVEAFLKLLP